ncbi:MAG: hypothetical protein AAFN08_03570 [Cyanobacteria bacterium J06559_3]
MKSVVLKRRRTGRILVLLLAAGNMGLLPAGAIADQPQQFTQLTTAEATQNEALQRAYALNEQAVALYQQGR